MNHKLKIGGKILITTKAFIRLNKANNITIKPAVLKKIPAFELFLIEKALKENRRSTGRVPKANDSIVSAPVAKLLVERV